MTLNAEILADGPTAYWRLGESSGTAAADSSGNGHTATYTGGFTLGAASLDASSVDTAVLLDGATGYIDAGDPGLWFAADFTVEFLFATTQVSEGFFLTKYDDSFPGTDNGIQLLIQGGQVWFAGRDGTGLYRQILSPLATYSDGLHHHYCAVRRGTVWELWVDGCLVVSADQGEAGDMSLPKPLYLGMVNDSPLSTGFTPDLFYGGVLDEVAIYDGTALSPTRIRIHADEAGMPRCPGKVLIGRVGIRH